MNYYEILEVSQNASPEVIKAAYKSLIQRYHPDKNPGNAEIAKRASLVVQAYDILSDLDKRGAYNLQLIQQSIAPLNNILGSDPDAFVAGAYSSRKTVVASRSYWYLWFLIILIIFSSWVILSLTKKRQSPESELKEIRATIAGKHLTQEQLQEKVIRMEAIFKENPGILKREESARADEEAARIIPILLSQLSVNLKIPKKLPDNKDKPLEGADKKLEHPGNASLDSDKALDEQGDPLGKLDKKLSELDKRTGDSGHVLSIPVLSVKVGSFDSEKVIQYLDSKSALISRTLAEKLADAKYEELVKIGGEEYLKKIILDSIGDTTGMNRFEDYPPSNTESPGRYGVVDVFFPEDFVVR